MNTTTFSLYELNALVRQTIEQTLDDEYWVEAELAECRVNRGHCYMELIQKDEHSNTSFMRPMVFHGSSPTSTPPTPWAI